MGEKGRQPALVLQHPQQGHSCDHNGSQQLQAQGQPLLQGQRSDVR